MPVEKSGLVLVFFCKLHNFILETSEILNLPEQSGLDNNCLEEPVDSTIHLQDTCDTKYEHHGRRGDLETSASCI